MHRSFSQKIALFVIVHALACVIPCSLRGQDVEPPINANQPADTLNRSGPGDSPPVYIQSNIYDDQRNIGYGKGYVEGKRSGAAIGQGQWFRTGCNIGCLLPCLGPTVTWIFAHNFGDAPLIAPAGDSTYKAGYYDGYFNATRDKKMNSILAGGLVGTGFSAGLVAVYYFVVKDVVNDLMNRWSDLSN